MIKNYYYILNQLLTLRQFKIIKTMVRYGKLVAVYQYRKDVSIERIEILKNIKCQNIVTRSLNE